MTRRRVFWLITIEHVGVNGADTEDVAFGLSEMNN